MPSIILKINKTEVIIFLLAFGIRFLYALAVQIIFGSHGFIAYSDAFSFYLRGAENLVQHHVFSMNMHAPYMPDAYRTPLYTFLVALFLEFKLPLIAIIFLQNILAGFISVFIYRLGRDFFSPVIGLTAAVLTSLEPLSIYWNNLLMSDYVFTFLFVWACYLLFCRKYYVFSLVLGLATLTRPISVYFLPIFLLWITLELKKEKLGLKRICLKLLLIIILFTAIIFPWMLRNKIVFDTWELSSSSWYNLGGNLMQEFADKYNINFSSPKIPPGYPNPELFNYDPVNTPFYQQQFFSIFKAHPFKYLIFHSSLALKSLIGNYYNYLIFIVIKPKFSLFFYGYENIVWKILIIFLFASIGIKVMIDKYKQYKLIGL